RTPTKPRIRFDTKISLECLPNAKENVEMTPALRHKVRRIVRAKTRGPLTDGSRSGLATGKRSRIQIVSEVEPYRTNGCFIAYTKSDSVGNIVVVAQFGGVGFCARLGIALAPVAKAVNHVASAGEYIPHVMEDSETDVVVGVGQGDRGKS